MGKRTQSEKEDPRLRASYAMPAVHSDAAGIFMSENLVRISFMEKIDGTEDVMPRSAVLLSRSDAESIARAILRMLEDEPESAEEIDENDGE